MKVFAKLKLLFTYPDELEDMLKKLKDEKEEKIRLSKLHNLNLCYEHRQESHHSHYSPCNCDYCNLEKKLLNALKVTEST